MSLQEKQLNTSRITVITRTKDRPWMLERAVKSVLSQTMPNWCHVIVNDGGDVPDLDSMLLNYENAYEGRLKVLHLTENVGMMNAANKAFEEVDTEFVCVHDDDDSWEAEFLAKTTDFLAEKGSDSLYQGVITHTTRVWEKLENDLLTEIRREAYQPLPEVSLYRVGFENPYPPISFVFRSAVLQKIGLLNPSFNYAADLDFNIRFLANYEVGVIKENLANYHWRQEGNGLNTVTEQASVHGLLLNEVLNHYLREQVDQKSNDLGLALNTARYAVNTQGRVEAVLERIQDLKSAVSEQAKGISEKHTDLLKGIREHLSSFNSLLEDIPADRHALVSDQLKGIREHLSSFNSLLEDIPTDRHALVSEKLSDLKGHLNSFNALLDVVPRERHEASLAAMASHNQALETKLGDLKEHLTSVSNSLFGDVVPLTHSIHEVVVQQTPDKLSHIENKLNQLESKIDLHKKSWKIGPFRIYWQPKESKKSK